MRQKIRLYIGGALADIADDALVLFTYTQQQLDNPTAIRNSYSNDITLPGTPANNRIFGSWFRNDRSTGSGGTGIGRDFNPLKRVPFQIYGNGDELLESGYVKLASVARLGEQIHSYSVNLFGGLGEFFYALSTDAATGNPLTLAALEWWNNQEQAFTPSDECAEFCDPQWIRLSWDALSGGSTYKNHVIQWIAGYDGIPDADFSADRVAYTPGDLADPEGFANYYGLFTEDGSFGPMPGAGNTILGELPREITALEAHDLRVWLLHPCLSVHHFLDALGNAAAAGLTDWAFAASAAVEAQVADLWYTLPRISHEQYTANGGTVTLAELLEGTPAPANLLIDIAKCFGWVFREDKLTKTITLCTRAEWYAAKKADVIDLTGRVDLGQQIDYSPVPAESRYYIWEPEEVYGAFAEEYADRYGITYGRLRVDTGYEFSTDEIPATDGIALNGVSDAQEASPLFFVELTTPPNPVGQYIPHVGITWTLYGPNGTTKEEEWYRTYYTMHNDYMSRPQFHDRDGAALDGAGVLLYFDGMASIGQVPNASKFTPWHLSGDTAAMLLLNDGKPCWNWGVSRYDQTSSAAARGIVGIIEMPVFRRWLTSAGAGVSSLDFGIPKEVAVPESTAGLETLYDRGWKNYIADKMDKDCRVMHCWCNLRGLRVDQSLFARFFWWDGAVWVLTDVTAHNIASDELTECTFIKVEDMDNYTN